MFENGTIFRQPAYKIPKWNGHSTQVVDNKLFKTFHFLTIFGRFGTNSTISMKNETNCGEIRLLENDLFKVLFDEAERRPLTVTELTADAKAVIEHAFSNVWVEGEVVNFVQASSGHWYFNLNDGTSQIKCVCWKGTNFKIRFKPQSGVEVRIRGKLTLYQARGDFQLQVESLEPSGEGALKAAFDQIKAKLDHEGLFAPELKRPMPFYPRRIGVVTTKTGAAFHDIMNVLTRRSRTVSVLLAHAQVQGEGSADSVRNAIERLNAYNDLATTTDKLDVIIAGRGGGSAEDLWAFNDEALARAIRASKIPVISAVGHEIDWTIADLVADARAATPSAAAEMVAGREQDILERLDSRSRHLTQRMEYDLLMARSSVTELTSRLAENVTSRFRRLSDRIASASFRFSPQAVAARFAAKSSSVELLAQRTSSAQSKYLSTLEDRLARNTATVEALSPLKVLVRGYSLTQFADGRVVRNAFDAAVGDQVNITLASGKLGATVTSTEEASDDV